MAGGGEHRRAEDRLCAGGDEDRDDDAYAEVLAMAVGSDLKPAHDLYPFRTGGGPPTVIVRSTSGNERVGSRASSMHPAELPEAPKTQLVDLPDESCWGTASFP